MIDRTTTTTTTTIILSSVLFQEIFNAAKSGGDHPQEHLLAKYGYKHQI